MNAAQRFDVTVAFLSSARFVTALTTASVGTAVLSFTLQQVIGWAGLLAILAGELALFAVVLVARRGEIEWSGLLPVSLMVFTGWAALSVFWSEYQWVTLGSLLYAFAFTVLGVSIALLRDTIQIVRAFGDVLRAVLTASLVIEVVSGLLIDAPIRFLSVRGDLDRGGPIQGMLGSANQLGIVALIALVTFITEWRTRSVSRSVSIGSVVLASLCVLLTHSAVAFGAAAIVGIAAAALYALRRTTPERRRPWQLVVFAGVALALTLTWGMRDQIISALDAQRPLRQRLNLWRDVWDLVPLHRLEGWGWVGHWRDDIAPYMSLRAIPDGGLGSAANAWLDVWLQLGLIGVVTFLLLVALAFTRSWLLAARKRSTVYTWPALVLVVLIVCSLAESMMLVEFGLLTLVVCTVKASRELSWRQAFAVPPAPPELG